MTVLGKLARCKSHIPVHVFVGVFRVANWSESSGMYTIQHAILHHLKNTGIYPDLMNSV